ncbi:unnamed protein product [Caenorhabditis angaria]|uniref:PUM-HD domain-containing protein n=1 Tax=Caenorhabditis angaria TaxID=860376 RepID=A0A9P1MX12_9PELO|nr:unnamed protein product [Caenorhabditis angaria]
MSNDSVKSEANDSDFFSPSPKTFTTDINMFNGSFDTGFAPNLSLFDFVQFRQPNVFSPQPLINESKLFQPIGNCRLSAALNPLTPSNRNNFSTSLEFREVVDRLPDLTCQDESFASFQNQNNSFVGNFSSAVRSTRLLPAWAVDENNHIRGDLTIIDVIRNGSLIDFAMDRTGVKFLEKNYPTDAESDVHRLLFEKLTEQPAVFIGLCRSSAGNFIVQKFVEFSTIREQEQLVRTMVDSGLFSMCLDKFACRVVQLAIQKFDVTVSTLLVSEISQLDLMPLCTDQCAIHVIQKIVKTMPINSWSFFVKFLCRDDNLMTVCQDKYGCRLVQQTIDKLSDNPKSPCFNTRSQLLHGLMTSVARNCYRLASNEFANYVVQYVIKSSGIMEMYRDSIIEKCLLRNLLSMSQDKYASHVVEGAFLFAPHKLLNEMMDEIFDGYVKDSETNRDALDILLFHQYGNYVIQQMISICISALLGKEERKLNPTDLRTYAKWFERIKLRVNRHAARLERFSSGKKIIESIQKINSNATPFQLPSIFNPTAPESIWSLPPVQNATNLLDVSAHFNNHQSVFDD